jgi:SnoaL-like domain
MGRWFRFGEGSGRHPGLHGKKHPWAQSGEHCHVLTNFVIAVHGDSATAWSRWTFVVPGPDKRPVMAQGGHYDDSLVREHGHWKFKQRVASVDIPAMVPTAEKK